MPGCPCPPPTPGAWPASAASLLEPDFLPGLSCLPWIWELQESRPLLLPGCRFLGRTRPPASGGGTGTGVTAAAALEQMGS